MKLRIMLGVIVNAEYYALLKGKKRDILADLNDIVHVLAAAKRGSIVNYIAVTPSTMVDGDSFDLDSFEEINAVLNRCKAYRKELALQLLEKAKV